MKTFRSHGNRLNTELAYCYSNHRKSINRQVHHTQCHDEHIQSKSSYLKPHVGFFFSLWRACEAVGLGFSNKGLAKRKETWTGLPRLPVARQLTSGSGSHFIVGPCVRLSVCVFVCDLTSKLLINMTGEGIKWVHGQH